ncbi:Na+/H+ antiporter subunit E [Clostridium malenominatum]|uniref:Na+/H+ antiporter subunit E n=1 Tax=Clostridium malenominatum TaxID=1539 RepID=A0ABN1IXG4_9CLOT
MKIWHSIVLVLFWIILSESFSIERVCIGIIIAYIISKFNEDLLEYNNKKLRWNVNKITIFFRYLWLLIIEIFKSCINVARIVLSPKMKISPSTCTIETKLKSNFLRTVLANSITLTPGTLTLFVDDNKITIHSLQEENLKDLEDSSFEKILLKVEEDVNE